MKVKVNDKTYIDFSSIEINRSLDSVASTFSISAYFDGNNKDQLEALRPLGYQDVSIKDDYGNVLITGIFLNTSKMDRSTSGLVDISGYTKSGVLSDVNVPVNVNSLQSNGLTLKEITEKIIEPYDLNLIIDENSTKKANEKVGRSYVYMNEALDKYIVDLALRKNIVVSHNTNGDLMFLSIDKNVKTKHKLNKENTISMKLNVNGQDMHSEISATRQVSRRSRKNPSPQVKYSTIVNPLVTKHRPKNKRTNMNSDMDLETSAKSFYMEELENISVDIELPFYYKDLVCGDFVEIINPDIFISKSARMLVKATNVRATESERSMSITCVIPEAYTGDIPKNIFEL